MNIVCHLKEIKSNVTLEILFIDYGQEQLLSIDSGSSVPSMMEMADLQKYDLYIYYIFINLTYC